MPVVITAVFTPADGRKDDLVAALRATIPAVHGEPGCDLYAIHDASDGTIVLIEKWASQEALDGHNAGEPIAALASAVQSLLGAPVALSTMAPIPLGGEAGVI